jgi:hypothetical protein
VVRPDKDAAGRLLEGASDRSPRGMTVRMGNYPTEPGLQAAHSPTGLLRKNRKRPVATSASWICGT